MRASIYTLGCKVNAYESEVMADLLKKASYEVVDDVDCDVCVINTCTVTNNADKKSRKLINQVIRNNRNAIIVVVGCFSQVKYEELALNKNIHIILGTSNKTKLVNCIEEFKKNKLQIIDVNVNRNHEFEYMRIENFTNKHRAFVKIQDGCDNFCSYCIIPFTRGKICCKKFEDVISEITSLVNNGFKEVVLTGIHTGSYYSDGNNFSSLVRKIVSIDGLMRLRISSIEITELDEDFFDLLSNTSIIVDHLHIPLQSGSDKVLALMNRKYDTEYYSSVIAKIRRIRPNISITTDVIVGFPGETDSDFLDMYKFIDQTNFSSLHVFPYSKRDFTKAALMDGHMDESIKAIRVKRLLDLKERKELEYMNSFVGKSMGVLFEVYDGNYYIGHTSNYLKVCVKSDRDIIGQLIMVDIQSVQYPLCIGVVRGEKI